MVPNEEAGHQLGVVLLSAMTTCRIGPRGRGYYHDDYDDFDDYDFDDDYLDD